MGSPAASQASFSFLASALAVVVVSLAQQQHVFAARTKRRRRVLLMKRAFDGVQTCIFFYVRQRLNQSAVASGFLSFGGVYCWRLFYVQQCSLVVRGCKEEKLS